MRSGTVYVIDDDPSVRRATGRLLETAGCDVVLCESAAAFLLEAAGRCLPIVFVTGIADDTVAARAHAVGAAFFLKPVAQSDLLHAVDQGLATDLARLTPPAAQTGR